jgi:hypothetical protein
MLMMAVMAVAAPSRLSTARRMPEYMTNVDINISLANSANTANNHTTTSRNIIQPNCIASHAMATIL